MNSVQNIADLIGLWPSLAEFARDAGTTYGAAKQMRRRSAVGVAYWHALIQSTRGQQLGLSADLLMSLHSKASDEAAA